MSKRQSGNPEFVGSSPASGKKLAVFSQGRVITSVVVWPRISPHLGDRLGTWH